MLFYKPHTATRYKAVESVSGSTYLVRGIYFDQPVTVKGQLTPSKPGVAFTAEGVEVQQAHDWLWDTADDFEVNDLVQVGERFFMVALPQQIWDAEPTTAFRQVVLEEVDAETVTRAQEL